MVVMRIWCLFFREILDFFIKDGLPLKAHIQKIFTWVDFSQGLVNERLGEMVSFIKEDERGV